MMLTCEVCEGKVEVEPEVFVEVQWTLKNAPAPADVSAADQAGVISAWREKTKRIHRVTDGELDRLIAGEVVTTGCCVCLPCQARSRENQQNPQQLPP